MVLISQRHVRKRDIVDPGTFFLMTINVFANYFAEKALYVSSSRQGVSKLLSVTYMDVLI